MVELIEYQLVEIQRESLVQGKFLVIPLFLLSKGERCMSIHCQKERCMSIHCQIYKAEMADLI